MKINITFPSPHNLIGFVDWPEVALPRKGELIYFDGARDAGVQHDGMGAPPEHFVGTFRVKSVSWSRGIQTGKFMPDIQLERE